MFSFCCHHCLCTHSECINFYLNVHSSLILYFVLTYTKYVQSDSDDTYVHFMGPHFSTAGTEINLEKYCSFRCIYSPTVFIFLKGKKSIFYSVRSVLC